jgi:hypothetical protein
LVGAASPLVPPAEVVEVLDVVDPLAAHIAPQMGRAPTVEISTLHVICLMQKGARRATLASLRSLPKLAGRFR